MDMDLATQMRALQGARTQVSAQIAIVKKNHEMEMTLVNMIDQVARAAPPPGQGTKVDKLA
ncbi:MAG TPA: hypothetical protein VIN06_03160 [Devosia sp.]